VVLVPGQFPGAPHPQGALASTMLSVAVASAVDTGRLARAKQYFNDGSVQRIELDTGVLRGTVMGSRPSPYLVEISVPVLERDGTVEAARVQLNRITPAANDLHCRCSCADPAPMCKHAAASVLALSSELRSRPELLTHWRTAPVGSQPKLPPGHRARRGAAAQTPPARPSVATRPERQPPVWASPEWQAFLGDPPPDVHTVLASIPSEMAPIGRAQVGLYDLGQFVREALLVLRNESDD
jgi:hypothetical protein